MSKHFSRSYRPDNLTLPYVDIQPELSVTPIQLNRPAGKAFLKS